MAWIDLIQKYGSQHKVYWAYLDGRLVQTEVRGRKRKGVTMDWKGHEPWSIPERVASLEKRIDALEAAGKVVSAEPAKPAEA